MFEVQGMVSALLTLIALFKEHPVLCTAIVLAYVGAQLWKARGREWREYITRTYPRLTVLPDLLNYLLPDVVAIARLVKYRAVRGESRATTGVLVEAHAQRPEVLPPAPSEQIVEASDEPGSIGGSSSGFIDMRLLLTIVLAVFAIAAPVLLLPGCPMPQIDNCTPLSVRCSPSGVPQHCDPDTRWTPVDDQCSRFGNECIVTRAYSDHPIAVCVRPDVAAEVRDAGR